MKSHVVPCVLSRMLACELPANNITAVAVPRYGIKNRLSECKAFDNLSLNIPIY